MFIGDCSEDSKLQNYVLPNLQAGQFETIYALDPKENTIDQVNKRHMKLIMSRYPNIDRVRDAEIVGILIGTVVVDNHMLIINRLKKAIHAAGKKYYEVLVGKINEPKLKNFQLIDLYVMIACPL